MNIVARFIDKVNISFAPIDWVRETGTFVLVVNEDVDMAIFPVIDCKVDKLRVVSNRLQHRGMKDALLRSWISPQVLQ